MRGKKGKKHADPVDPPRCRANKQRGHGTFATDRPPVAGVVGRASGLAQLFVLEDVSGASLQGFVGRVTRADVVLYTDEWGGYAWVGGTGRGHATVCHTPGQREWARDDDGDGVREVHNNTLEGLWQGLRNFLRPFRGVSKWFLDEYVGIFQWAHTLKAVTAAFIRALFGLPLTTNLGP
jgi:transposase